jgi:hypothetical protein
LQENESKDSNTACWRSWTSADESALSEEWEQGLSVPDIAGLHQRRAGGIMARLKTLGLLPEEATQEEAEKLQQAKRPEV